MKNILVLLLVFISIPSMAQDNITINGVTYDIVITKETSEKLFYYKHGDELKEERSLDKSIIEEISYHGSDEALSYSSVIEVEGASKAELKRRTRIWFAEAFNDSNEVVQSDDNNHVVGKGSFNAGNYYGHIEFLVKVYLKEGRYKYEITDFNDKADKQYINGYNISTPGYGILMNTRKSPEKPFGQLQGMWDRRYLELLQIIESRTQQFINSLNESLSSSIDEDW